MSLFKRMLSSVGIGAAKVDTVLEDDEFEPGDEVDAVVKIKGGKTEQQIDGLYFSIHCHYKATREIDREFDGDDEDYEEEEDEVEVTRTATIDKFKLSESMTISPGEEIEIPLSFQLPYHTPLTLGRTKVWITTGLDIKKSVDPGDKDYITVEPGELVSALFDSMESLGFRLSNADCEAIPESLWDGLPFVQEFEFKPFHGSYKNRLDEIEVVCFPAEDEVEVFIEIDRKVRGIGSLINEMMGEDESHLRFTFGRDDIADLTDKLAGLLARWS